MHNKFSIAASKLHHLAWCTVLAISLAACGADDSASTAAQTSATTSAASQPFTLNGVPQTSVMAGSAYRYTPSASGVDGRVLAYDIVNKPEWAAFDETSGELSGTPDASNVGTTGGIEIGVSNGTTRATVGPFNIRVIPDEVRTAPVAPHDPVQPIAPPTTTTTTTPSPPTISGAPSLNGLAGQPYSFTPVVSDPSGEALTFSIVNRPAWATFSTATGQLSGTPTSADVGKFTNIVISVSTVGVPVSLPVFSIQVKAATDSTPTISGTPTTTVAVGGNYAFTPVASDPDGNALTFSILNAPSWASFDAGTGQLSGTPAAANVGSYPNILISVSDGTATVSLAAFSITVTQATTGGGGSSPAGQPFPHFGVQAIAGNQVFPAANDNQLAQYPWILLGGNWDAWPSSSGRTRQALVASLKGQSKTGKNAVTPIVGQYENLWEMNVASPWFSEWTAKVAANNWYLYINENSGTLAQSVFNSAYNLVDMSATAGPDSATGLYPAQQAALMLNQMFITGAIGPPGNAASNLDFVYVDNTSVYNLSAESADWLRNGTQQGSNDATSIAAVTAGKAQLASYWETINPTQGISANTSYAYGTEPTNVGGMGLDGSNIRGQFSYPMQQFVWETAGGPNSATLTWGSPTLAMAWYKAQMASAKAGSVAVLTGGVVPTDAQLVRFTLTMMLMDNGYGIYGMQGPGSDTIDGANTSTFPVFDEFWGGSLNLGGYLGAPSADAQGAVQTSAWSNGVWRRDFENGIALWNASGSSQTVNLGGTYYHIKGTTSVNTGAAATSVTIPASDGLIMLNSPPP